MKDIWYHGGVFKTILIALSWSIFAISSYAFGPIDPDWNWILEGDVFDIAGSKSYVLVGEMDRVHLFGSEGEKIWDYDTGNNITAVAISEVGGYAVAASKDGNVYVIDLNGSLIKALPFSSGGISGFDLGKPNWNVTNAVFPYPEKGHFLAFGDIPGSEGNVHIFRYHPSTKQPGILGLEDSISNYTDPCNPSKVFMERVSDWGFSISVWGGAEAGKMGLGVVNSHCSQGNYTVVSTRFEKLDLVTLFDFSKTNNSVVWQIKPSAQVDSVILSPDGSWVFTYTGNKLAGYNNPSIKEQVPKIVVLANVIDQSLASDFFGVLENNGIIVIKASPSSFEQYNNNGFIVILGGPDAPEGVGAIVQQVLSEEEQDSIRESGARKKYTKTNVWAQGQRVTVLAGSGRNQTKMAHEENSNQVALEAKKGGSVS